MKKFLGRLARRLSSRSLRAKLFFSHLIVPLVGSLAFMAGLHFVAPALFGVPSGGFWGSLRETYGAPVLYSLLVGGLAAAAVAAAVSLTAAHRLATPVRRMLAAAVRISTGRRGERVPVGADDEIGALARGFNAMAAALEEGERQRREFISDVSHELRTPLSTLRGYTEGLMDGVVEPDDGTWALMHSHLERMHRLVEDLSQLSRAEAGDLALDVCPVMPASVVGPATEGMRPLFSVKKVELGSEVPGTLPRVLADADRLSQVLANLLGNALRHTPEGGRVAVTAEARSGAVLFAVSDTGVGMARGDLPRVFERFYRAEKSRSRGGARGGSGLGLAISRALVEAMGGEISAESAGPGEGATFSFTLPAATPDS